VVDSADRERMIECNAELEKLLEKEDLANVPLLVFANKQDLGLALTAEEIAESLKLESITDRKWSIYASCAVTKEGIS
jgi:signal recognition particle receptor subunit beta